MDAELEVAAVDAAALTGTPATSKFKISDWGKSKRIIAQWPSRGTAIGTTALTSYRGAKPKSILGFRGAGFVPNSTTKHVGYRGRRPQPNTPGDCTFITPVGC